MNAILKCFAIAGALAVAALSSGCASVSLDNDGGNGSQAQRPDFILSQLEADSRGK